MSQAVKSLSRGAWKLHEAVFSKVIEPPAIERKTLARFVAIFVFFFFAYALITSYTIKNWSLTADEPHYLTIAESIGNDGDLDLSNNSAHCALDPHVNISEEGYWRPAHMVGLPLLLAAPYRMGARAGASLFMMTIAALTVAFTYLLAMELTSHQGVALTSAIILGATPPFLLYSSMIYPEMPGALFIAVALFSLYRAAHRYGAYLAIGITASLMPWQVVRFAPVALCVVLMAAARAMSSSHRKRNLAALMIPCFVSAGLYLIYNWHIYGSSSPFAVYGNLGPRESFGNLVRLLTSTMSWFLDQRCGLLVFAPFYLYSFSGLFYLSKIHFRALPVTGLALLHILFNTTLPGFWVQWAPPTRYLVAILPMLVIGVSYVIWHARGVLTRAGLLFTLVVAMGGAGLALLRPWLYYNDSFSEAKAFAWLSQVTSVDISSRLPLAESARIYKDKRHPDRDGVLLYFPGVETLAVNGGQLLDDSLAMNGRATLLSADEGATPSAMSAQLSDRAAKGRYVLRVRLKLAHEDSIPLDAIALRITIIGSGGNDAPLGFMEWTADDLTETYRWLEMPFRNEAIQPIRIAVEHPEAIPIWVDGIVVTHLPDAAHGWGLMAVWAFAVVFLAWMAYRDISSSHRRGRGRPLFVILCVAGCLGMLLFYTAWFQRVSDPVGWRYDAEGMRGQVGRARLDPAARNWLASSTDQAGALAFGPYMCFEAGEYDVLFRMRLGDEAPTASHVATVDVTTDGGNHVLASADVRGAELAVTRYRDIALRFRLAEPQSLEYRVLAQGQGALWLDEIVVSKTDR